MARGTKITPVLRYRNPRTAARWLCEAFGFHEHDTAQEADGQVRYVLLRLGDSFVLVRPVANLGFDDLLVQPEAVGGANTQVCYVTVADADGHRARAGAAGARIEIEPQDDGVGGQFYTCRDLEGHLWSFGTRTYGLAGAVAGESQPVEPSRQPSTALAVVHPAGRPGRGLLLRSAGAAAAVAVLALGGWIVYRTYAGAGTNATATVSTALSAQVEDMRELLAQERSRRSAAEDVSRDAAAKLAEERTAAADARQTLQRAQAELARERRERDEALTALASSKALAEDKVAQEQVQRAALAKSASEQAASLQEQLAKLQQDRVAERERLNEAKTALLAAQTELEALRATKQGSPKAEDANPAPAVVTGQNDAAKSSPAQPPDAQQTSAADPGIATASVPDENPPEPKAADTKATCASAVQGKIPFGHKASSTWAEANLARLCQGAETSLEPGKCFEELMRGKVSWGGGRVWTNTNALALCAGTRNARRILDCFAARLAAEETWQAAIRQCRAN